MMTDQELLSYAARHCRTELGQIHRDHVARILTLSGMPTAPKDLQNEWYYLGPAAIDPIVASAREALGIE